MRSESCALEVDGARLEVDPRAGGRVTSLCYGDDEVLSGQDAHADNYGSTFWTSPQSAWGWPPPAEIDSAPYSAVAAPGALVLSGPPQSALGVRVSKRFTIDRTRRAFLLEYVVHNVGMAPMACAHWEVTRVRPGGLTFFPSGSPTSGALPLDERADATWYVHEPGSLPETGQKAFADGKGGLLAHAAG